MPPARGAGAPAGAQQTPREIAPWSSTSKLGRIESECTTAAILCERFIGEAFERIVAPGEGCVPTFVDRHLLEEGLGLDSWIGPFVKALAERFRDVDAKLTQMQTMLSGD